MVEPPRLFSVEYASDGDDLSLFVVATTHQEAFELWRIAQGVVPETARRYYDFKEDGEVRVRMLNPPSGASRVLEWDETGEVIDFALDYENLTTHAIRLAQSPVLLAQE